MSLAAGAKGQRDREGPTAACGDRKVCSNTGKRQFSLSKCVLIIILMYLQGRRLLLYTEAVSAANYFPLKKNSYLFSPGFVSSSVVLAVIPM